MKMHTAPSTPMSNFHSRLLFHMRRQIVTGVVDVNKCTVYDWDGFQHVLQTLAVADD